jgi:hypothetical protein
VRVDSFEDQMAKPVSKLDAEMLLGHLFDFDEGLPCPEETDLLIVFVKCCPSDFAFLKSRDLVQLRNSGFAGIADWEMFLDRYGSHELWNA